MILENILDSSFTGASNMLSMVRSRIEGIYDSVVETRNSHTNHEAAASRRERRHTIAEMKPPSGKKLHTLQTLTEVLLQVGILLVVIEACELSKWCLF